MNKMISALVVLIVLVAAAVIFLIWNNGRTQNFVSDSTSTQTSTAQACEKDEEGNCIGGQKFFKARNQ